MRESPPSSGPVLYKFGGSSVGDADRIRHVARLIVAAPSTPVVVVSAVRGVTDRLAILARERGRGIDIGRGLADLQRFHRRLATELAGTSHPELHRQLVGEIATVVTRLTQDPSTAAPGTAEDADRFRATGEDLSTLLLVAALRTEGHPARHVDARRIVRTDSRFTAAGPDEPAIRTAVAEHLAPVVAGGEIAVVQGFVGSAPDGRTTTLGRGGSDLSASLLGAALGSPEIHIWTDVDGVLSGDPHAVDAPRPLARLGYEEAVELAYFGARVLHPGAAEHAVSRGLAVRVRSTFTPDRPGTLILRERWGPPEIAAVAFKPQVALLQVRSHPSAMPYGFLARVFDVLARHKLPVDLVATSHTSTAFTIDSSAETAAAAAELRKFADVTIRTSLVTVTVVGHGLLEQPGVDARIFAIIDRTPVHLVSQASNVSLSFVVDADAGAALVRRLHRELIETSARDAS